MNIINNVAEVLYWDIFVMGLFSIITVGLGLMWLFLRCNDLLNKVSGFAKKATEQKWMTTAVTALVAVIAIYYVGAIFNTFSDDWIDKGGFSHLYLKGTWMKAKYDIGELGTDDAIKTDVFHSIYGLEKQNPSDIRDFYYHAKNELWKEEKWREYILYSQTMINISRVWCLALFLTIPLAIARIAVSAYRWRMAPRRKPKEVRDAKDVILSFVAVAVAVAGYYVGGVVWQSSEVEIDSKIFGVYRSVSEMAPPLVEAIKKTETDWRMSELMAPRKLEASGVAEFEGHLVIVNDRDNALYIADPEILSRQLTVIEVPELPPDRAKFEDVSFHKESGYFYAIGAHFCAKEQYQQTIRFKLEKDKGEWKPTKPERLEISEEILGIICQLPERSSIEGIAVTGSDLNPSLYVGVRTPGRFLILEFSKDRSKFKLGHTHEIVPRESNPSGTPYHLSGLAVASETSLLILATTEDNTNGFHGNRLYIVDRRDWTVKSVTPEFAIAQKAEGVTIWGDNETGQRVAIVFDNDQEDTKQPSRILIGPSHLKWLP